MHRNRRRTIAGPNVHENSRRHQPAGDPDRLNNQTPHHIGTSQARKIDFLVPVRDLIAVRGESNFLIQRQVDLKFLKLRIEKFAVLCSDRFESPASLYGLATAVYPCR